MVDEHPKPEPSIQFSSFGQRVRRPPLSKWTVPVVGLIVLIIGGTAGWLLWAWIDSLAFSDPEKKIAVQLDSVKIAASIAVGGGGLFALYLAARRQRTQELELEARHAELWHRAAELAQRDRAQAHIEQVSEHNRVHVERIAGDSREDAAVRRVTELYTRATELIGSDKAPVRLAGFYALVRLSRDNEHQRQTVIDVLCAYLRMPYELPGEQPGTDVDESIRVEYRRSLEERQVRHTVQRILAAHLSPGTEGDAVDAFWSDIDLDLTGATLVEFDLSRCRMRSALFERATFIGETRFNQVEFLDYASFDQATFADRVEFEGVQFNRAAKYSKATFLGDAWFSDAKFHNDVLFLDSVFGGRIRFDRSEFRGAVAYLYGAIIANPTGDSVCPAGWLTRPQHHPVKDRPGTWHSFDPVPLKRRDSGEGKPAWSTDLDRA